jgi:hypothetical protein
LKPINFMFISVVI